MQGGGRPICASTLEIEVLPTPPPEGLATHGLTHDELVEKRQLIVDAAIRLWKAGFDAVEIHAAHGYFLNSFLSPIWNHRDDEYGPQTAESRTRIMREIYDMVRDACGPDFVIGTRINGQEWSPLVSGGITPELARRECQGPRILWLPVHKRIGLRIRQASLPLLSRLLPLPRPRALHGTLHEEF